MAEQFPAELERRIESLESGAETGDDFDAVSWRWLIALGVLLPIALLAIGWWL